MKIILALFIVSSTATYANILIAHRGVHQTYHREGLDNFTCTASRINPVSHNYLENTLGSVPETYFTFNTEDMVYTFPMLNGSSIGSTFLLLSSKYPKS